MKGGVVDDAGSRCQTRVEPTEAPAGRSSAWSGWARSIRQAVAAAGLTMSDIAAIGVATPGTMDIPAGVILDPPNLQAVAKRAGAGARRRHVRLPTAFQNDANAAAYGEFWVGAGRDVHSMVLFTLGTGIGGGIILGDMVLEGEHSHGAECGHIEDRDDQRPAVRLCGRRGCLEAYASATAVVKRADEALRRDAADRRCVPVCSTGKRRADRPRLSSTPPGGRRAGRPARRGDGLLPGGRRDERSCTRSTRTWSSSAAA